MCRTLHLMLNTDLKAWPCIKKKKTNFKEKQSSHVKLPSLLKFKGFEQISESLNKVWQVTAKF